MEKKLRIYRTNYIGIADEVAFDTYDEAAEYAFEWLPTDDIPYMIGTKDGVAAFVFQGVAYVPDVPPLDEGES